MVELKLIKDQIMSARNCKPSPMKTVLLLNTSAASVPGQACGWASTPQSYYTRAAAASTPPRAHTLTTSPWQPSDPKLHCPVHPTSLRTFQSPTSATLTQASGLFLKITLENLLPAGGNKLFESAAKAHTSTSAHYNEFCLPHQIDLRKLSIAPDSPHAHPPHTVAAWLPKDLGL